MPVKNQRKYFYVDRLVRVSIYWFSINSHLGRSVCVSWRNLSSFVLTVTTSVRAYVHGWRCLQKAGTFQGQFLKTVHPRQSLAGFVFILLSLSSRVVFRETNRDFHYPAYRRTQTCLSLHGTIGPSYLYFHPRMNIYLKAPLLYLENWIYFWIQNFWITEDDPSLWTTRITLSLGSAHVLDSN